MAPMVQPVSRINKCGRVYVAPMQCTLSTLLEVRIPDLCVQP